MDLKKLINDHFLLELACEQLAEPMIREITNQTLTASDFNVEYESLSFKVVQSWQGDAESHHFKLPCDTIIRKMEQIDKEANA